MARRIRWQIVVAGIAALIVVGLLGQLALATTAVSEPETGGTYREAIPGVPVSVNPLVNDPLTDPVGQDVVVLVFDGLTRIGFDGRPAPALATRWQAEQDGQVYVVELREDVVWHDGEPFTADDVMFTVRALKDENFSGNAGLVAFWRDILVDRIDDYTLRFTLDGPYAPFPGRLADLMILPEHRLGSVPVDEWPGTAFARQPIGTGPYQVIEVNTERALFEANNDYFAGRPFIDSVELRFIETPEAAIPLLNEDTIDAVGGSSAAAPELAQLALPATLRRVSVPLDAYVGLTFNLREPPLAARDLRLALAYGLNKNDVIDAVLGGQVARLDTPILPGWWSYDPTVGWYVFDPEQAAQVLDSLGYTLNADGVRTRASTGTAGTDGLPLAFTIITDGDPGRLAAAENIAQQWGRLGIQVTIEELDGAELRQRLSTHEFTMALHGWSRLGADPDVYSLWHSSQTEAGLNYAGLADETIDDLLLSGRTAQTIAARNEDYAAFQRRWRELVPGIMLYQPVYHFVVSNDVGGIDLEQNSPTREGLLVGREDRYRMIARWFVQSSREIRGTLR